MPSLLWLALSTLTLLYLANLYRRFSKHLRAAKASGIPYVVSPIHGVDLFWLITEHFWWPILRRLPTWATRDWIDVVSGDWIWNYRYTINQRLGSDTFLVVSPLGLILNVADPDVITQITTRRNDFPKPTRMYKTLDVYGKNVVSHEGVEWRRHRKITSPPFTEKNNHLVWAESLYQAQNMLMSWVGKEGKGDSGTVESVPKDAMRLSLHVISRAGFDVRCLWPGVDDTDEKAIAQGAMTSNIIPEGHTMSYVETMEMLLHRLIVVILFPEWFLKYSPWKFFRESRQCFIEWGKYMNEIYERKKTEILANTSSPAGIDLMRAMVEGSGLIAGAGKPSADTSGLSESEIMGNAFVFMLAGHETAANTINNAIIYLAMWPSAQARLQKELDAIFDGRPPARWDYERDVPLLFGGMPGAVMNEALRLIPPVVNIPKCTETAQRLAVNGKECVVPADVYIALGAVNVHRNPKVWPHGKPRDPSRPAHPTSNVDNDLEEFHPERWILDPAKRREREGANGHAGGEAEANETADLGVSAAADTAASLFRPPRGAYVPFSEGYRACLGRRFAQVEILATLAVVFQRYSVELAVDTWAGDEEVERMREEGDEEGLRRVWGMARDEADRLLREGMSTIITIQMRSGKVPLRFVRRGGERFAGVGA